MFEELEFYLHRTMPEARADLLLSVFELIEPTGLVPLTGPIENFLQYDAQLLTTTDANDALTTLAWKSLEDVLNAFGVFIDSDVLEFEHIELLRECVRGLLALDGYDDTTRILAILENAQDLEMCFFELIEETTGLSVLRLGSVVTEVSPSLLQRVREITERHAVEQAQDAHRTPVDVVLNRTRAYLQRTSTEGPVTEYVRMGGVAGQSPETYTAVLKDDLCELKGQTAAEQLILLLCYSVVPNDEIETQAIALSNTLYQDVNTLLAIQPYLKFGAGNE